MSLLSALNIGKIAKNILNYEIVRIRTYEYFIILSLIYIILEIFDKIFFLNFMF